MVIFRENTEDIYAGIEWAAETPEAKKVIAFLAEGDGRQEDPLPGRRAASASSRSRARAPSGSCAPRSTTRSSTKRKSVTLVHKGNIMKFTEGAFRDWGYALATREFRDADASPSARAGSSATRRRSPELSVEENAQADRARLRHDDAGPAGRRSRTEVEAALALWPTHGDGKWKKMLLIRDSIADITLQQVLTRAEGVRRHRHAEPQRRLPLRRARGAGRRHRHRARRQHQLRHRPRHLRGHARHRAEVRQPRQGEPGLGDPLRRDDVRATSAGTRPRT